MGVSRLANRSETGEHQTQEVLEATREKREHQGGTIRISTELSEAEQQKHAFEGQNNSPAEFSTQQKCLPRMR